MTSIDEDILLDEPTASEFDHSTLLDEDLLLGAGDIANKSSNYSIDELALLDSVEPASEQDPEHAPDTDNNVDQDQDEEDVHGGAAESDKEELDYDEEEDDDDRRERTSRYTSEKKGGARVNSDDSEDSKKENSAKNGKPGIPSLFDKTITNNPLKSGDQPIGVVLRIEGEPERVFYPPPAFMASINNPQIVPRLPNGIPLVGAPSNHGRAGFGIGYQHQTRLAGGGGMGGAPQNPGQWENEVAQFMTQLNKGRGRVSGKKRRSTSYSSASSDSSDSRSRSRSSSRDRRRDEKKRRRDHREVRSYKREDRRDDRDRRRHEDRRRERDSYRDSERERDSRRKKEETRASTMESAKALGLSNDYINQMNEQKRKREEIVRKKEERRHGPLDKKENISAPAPIAQAAPAVVKDKQKAFLAVNVSGVQQVPTAKIEEMAKKIGPLRKCWRSTDDVVTIIFIAHDKAKEFMIQNNGKVQAGVRLAVTLEKKFLNASEVN